eukprot:1181737-Prorocentrum_minimum.AAC.4
MGECVGMSGRTCVVPRKTLCGSRRRPGAPVRPRRLQLELGSIQVEGRLGEDGIASPFWSLRSRMHRASLPVNGGYTTKLISEDCHLILDLPEECHLLLSNVASKWRLGRRQSKVTSERHMRQ